MNSLTELKQGSPEWLALRKSKITGTDSRVIMDVDPWKTKLQLYNEKLSPSTESFMTPAMQRGLDLEPLARMLFCNMTGSEMIPSVLIKDWTMASLDGINSKKEVLEIKCPNEKTHEIAKSGKIPEYYLPQLQHQMYVADSEKAFYFSFDGIEGIILECQRDDKYIKNMIKQEKEFYELLQSKTPPEPSEKDYIHKDDEKWSTLSATWQSINANIKLLENECENIKHQLIALSGGYNARGAGISLCQVTRKGNVDYSKIPELKNVNLEQYRKHPINSWRLQAI